MRRRKIALALLAVLAAPAAARAADKEKLRQLAHLPSISVFGNIGFTSTDGFFLGEKPAAAAEIASLEKALRGDATDAGRYCRLGRLYSRAGQPAKSKKAYAKAVEICRRQAKARPAEVYWLVQLGDALDGLDRSKEAEAVLRRAAREGPKDWRCWLGLAALLESKAFAALAGGGRFSVSWDLHDPGKLMRSLQALHPSAQAVADWERCLKEVRACYDRAIRLAPREPEPYRKRALSGAFASQIRSGLESLHGEKAPSVLAVFVAPAVLADLRQAARLSPDDYPATGALVALELVGASLRQKERPIRQASADKDALTDAARQSLRECLTRLDEGTRNKDRRAAATATEVLGLLQMFSGHESQSIAKFRRAVDLDPDRETSWDLLTVGLAENRRYKECLAVCRDRLKHKDSARGHFLLAKVYEAQRRPDRAEKAVRRALKLEPDYFLGNLGLVAARLRRGGDADLRRAKEILDKLASQLDKGPKGDNRHFNYDFTRAVYLGLTGDVPGARKLLEQLRERDPKDKQVAQALKALEE